jgi:hypothetical protein
MSVVPVSGPLVVDPTAVKYTMIATGVLATKIFFATMVQGSKRFKAGKRAPEDAQMPLNPKVQLPAPRAHRAAASPPDPPRW